MPAFEPLFFLKMKAFGKVYPSHRREKEEKFKSDTGQVIRDLPGCLCCGISMRSARQCRMQDRFEAYTIDLIQPFHLERSATLEKGKQCIKHFCDASVVEEAFFHGVCFQIKKRQTNPSNAFIPKPCAEVLH